MGWMYRLWNRLQSLRRRRQLDRGLEDQLRFHIEMMGARSQRRFGNATALTHSSATGIRMARRQRLRRRDYTFHRSAVGLEGHLLIEHAGFERPGAALTPVRGAHFLDHAELDFVGGLEAVDALMRTFSGESPSTAMHLAQRAVTDSV
jgi:hypothetical protein